MEETKHKAKQASNTANLIMGVKIFLKQLPQVKGLYFINLIGWTLLYLSMMVPGLVYKDFFEYLESGQAYDFNTLLTIIAPQILTMLLRVSLILITGYFFGKLIFKAAYGMKWNLIDMILSQRPEKMKFSMGEAINSIKEDPQHVTFALDNSMDFIGKLAYNVVVFFILYRLDREMTLVLFLPLFLVAYLANGMSNRIINNRRKSRKGSALVSSLLGDIFNNIQAVKVNHAKNDVINRLKEYGEIRRQAMVKDSLIQELLWNMTNNISGFGTALMLLVAAIKIRQGTFTPAGFVIFNYYIWHVVSFFEWVGRQASRFQQSTVSHERMLQLSGQTDDAFLYDVMDFNSKKPLPTIEALDNPKEFDHLKVEHLTSTFQGKNGIQDVSFDVKAGEFFVITGRIGSGKSTLLRTLLGIKTKESGSILWDGTPLGDPHDLMPPYASYTSQTPTLFSQSIVDNITLGHEVPPSELQSIYQDAILHRDLAGFEEGDRTLIGTNGVKLSGGQKQRVAIARMLSHKASIYVLDDVSSALDVDTELSLWEHLEQRGGTRIAVSNRPVCLQRADRVLVLKDGAVDSIGTPEELCRTSPEYRAILGGIVEKERAEKEKAEKELEAQDENRNPDEEC